MTRLLKVDSLSFGSIAVDGERHRRDVILLPGGALKHGRGDFWKTEASGFKRHEIEELVEAGAEEIVVGTGTNAKAGPSNEAKSRVEQAQLQLHSLPSCEAVPVFNRLVDQGKTVAALVHIAC
jgi:hypothetical protein